MSSYSVLRATTCTSRRSRMRSMPARSACRTRCRSRTRTSCKLVQNWNFGGVPNAPTTGFRRNAVLNFNHTYDITDSVAKVHDTHTLKGGIYLHKSLKDQTAFTSVNGIINFDRDANNPNDANWAFANTLLGQLRHPAAIQPGVERAVPVVERGVVYPGQLARDEETDARVRHPVLLGPAAIRQGAANLVGGTRRSTIRRRGPCCAPRDWTPTAIASPSIR